MHYYSLVTSLFIMQYLTVKYCIFTTQIFNWLLYQVKFNQMLLICELFILDKYGNIFMSSTSDNSHFMSPSVKKTETLRQQSAE